MCVFIMHVCVYVFIMYVCMYVRMYLCMYVGWDYIFTRTEICKATLYSSYTEVNN